jgi:glycosyltransferase involved in cell wall biosynthesis
MNRNGVNRRPKITYIVTAAMSTFFFRGQLAYMINNGWEVEVISGPGPQLEATRNQGARPWVIPMEREIAPFKDLLSLWRLWRHLCHASPDLVVAGTPKAGFLGTIAARLAGVPHVVYTLHGLRLETALGWKRQLLWLTEWLACHAADGVRSISPSLRTRAIALGLVSPKRCNVVGAGTSNGVDTEHWRRTSGGEAAGQKARERWGIPPGAPLVGFVGRLTRDKGVVDLYRAFKQLAPCHPNLRLLFVGDFEAGDPVPAATRDQIEADPAVVVTGFVSEVAPYYWAMDVLTLPTYREGMGGVLLEAQAASIPVIGTSATGAIDAVVDGVTGLQVPPGDVAALTAALNRLLSDSALRARMGRAGCNWIQKNFQCEAVWRDLLADYRSLIDGSARTARNALASRS